jgi:uncharacterized membrane protein
MTRRTLARNLLAVLIVGAGISHFARTDLFLRIMPDYLPSPSLLVWISGLFEVLGGVGLLVPRSRFLSAVGLIALYIAVFPANINMAVHATRFPEIPAAVLWLRLPFQAVLIACVWWAGQEKTGPSSPVEGEGD